MFYCVECRKTNDWPVTLSTLVRTCEVCGRHGACYNGSGGELRGAKPAPPPAEPAAAGVAEGGDEGWGDPAALKAVSDAMQRTIERSSEAVRAACGNAPAPPAQPSPPAEPSPPPSPVDLAALAATGILDLGRLADVATGHTWKPWGTPAVTEWVEIAEVGTFDYPADEDGPAGRTVVVVEQLTYAGVTIYHATYRDGGRADGTAPVLTREEAEADARGLLKLLRGASKLTPTAAAPPTAAEVDERR